MQPLALIRLFELPSQITPTVIANISICEVKPNMRNKHMYSSIQAQHQTFKITEFKAERINIDLTQKNLIDYY